MAQTPPFPPKPTPEKKKETLICFHNQVALGSVNIQTEWIEDSEFRKAPMKKKIKENSLPCFDT